MSDVALTPGTAFARHWVQVWVCLLIYRVVRVELKGTRPTAMTRSSELRKITSTQPA